MEDLFETKQHSEKKYTFPIPESIGALNGQCLPLTDACTVEKGEIAVWLAERTESHVEKKKLLCRVSATEERKKTIPGFSAAKKDGRYYVFFLEGTDNTEITIREGGAQDRLRKNFLKNELKLSQSTEQSYEQCILSLDVSQNEGINTSEEYRSEEINSAESAEEISLDGTSRYLTETEDCAYQVLQGSVYVFIAPLGKDGLPQRARPYALVEEGQRIPALCYTTPGDYRKWRFVLTGRGEAKIRSIPQGADDTLKQKFVLENAKGNHADADLFAHEGFQGCLIELYESGELKERVDIRQADAKMMEEMFAGMGILNLRTDYISIEGNDPLYCAAAYAFKALHMEIVSVDELALVCSEVTLEAIAEASDAACRRIVLEKGWYRSDCGVIVSDIDGEPVALVPSGWNRYEIYYGAQNRHERLTKSQAEKLNPKAFALYRTLPEKKLTKKELFQFGWKSVRSGDLTAVLILSLIGVLIGILMPVLNQKIYDEYIPLGNVSELVQICVVIASFMISNLFFEVVKSLSEFRISSRIGYDLQNAIYYRIFRLPESFFRGIESADFAERISGITNFCNVYVEAILVSGLGAIFSLIYLRRMYKYASKLVLWALLMLGVYAVLVLVLNLKTIRTETQIREMSGKASSKLFQFLNGVEKIRMSGSEERMANEYLKPFVERERLEIRQNRITAFSSSLSGIASNIFSMVFYCIIVNKILKSTGANAASLSTGGFMGFNSAFGAFSSAIFELVSAFVKIYQLRPQYERIRGVVETEPEGGNRKGQIVTSLKGEVSLRNVKFTYDSDLPNVLDGITMDIHPGEYVGIVGRSGCGKSTLLKLLLGFEQPQSGAVLYDGKSMQSLDKQSLRRKLGVVLQNGKLISGSIFENITITAPYATKADVDAVIEKVGLKDDIAQMPMGLQTVLSEDAGTISGGQQQRILIARSIINNPAVLIFDEATSALDNLTQAAVCQSLDEMHSTRIVVAHRLSTIKNCDRIFVIDKGRIAEEGSYAALMKQKGMFYQLAVRQLVDGEQEEA